ncbi:MAG: EamA family transporter [Inquilinus sp.]|nr:EamA family transporter [Inquilinus sp.]
METHIAALVLLAALLHAGWNTLVKRSTERLAMMALLGATSFVVASAAAPFLPWPAAAGWPYIIASVILHIGYQLFLIAAYRHGDLSEVYPIARGGAPVLTTLAALWLVGETLSSVTLAGIALVAAGIMSLSLQNRAALFRANPGTLFYAVGTAGFIASYTVCDGLGVRAAESPHAYTVWLFLLEGVSILAIAAAIHRRRLPALLASGWRVGAVAGTMSLIAYWLVLWALSLGAIAPVAALRETSVVFAAILGALFLGERMTALRVVAAALVAAGVILIKL